MSDELIEVDGDGDLQPDKHEPGAESGDGITEHPKVVALGDTITDWLNDQLGINVSNPAREIRPIEIKESSTWPDSTTE